jgi:hypothetical protein
MQILTFRSNIQPHLQGWVRFIDSLSYVTLLHQIQTFMTKTDGQGKLYKVALSRNYLDIVSSGQEKQNKLQCGQHDRGRVLNWVLMYKRSRDSSVSIVTDYGLTAGVRSPTRQRIFLLVSASRPALGPTQPPVQWVPGVLSPGVKRGRGVTLTTHPLLVPRLTMNRSYTSSPPMSLHGM